MPDDCKKLRSEPYDNPNNYDIEFDVTQIPVNIPVENGRNLEKRLQKLMPLGKIIHVSQDNSTRPGGNGLKIGTYLNIRKDGNLIHKVRL